MVYLSPNIEMVLRRDLVPLSWQGVVAENGGILCALRVLELRVQRKGEHHGLR